MGVYKVIGILIACWTSLAWGQSYDVVVIGAGPAGLMAAIQANNAGVPASKILVLEKRPQSSEGPSTSQLSPWGSRKRTILVDWSTLEIVNSATGLQVPRAPINQLLMNTIEGHVRVPYAGLPYFEFPQLFGFDQNGYRLRGRRFGGGSSDRRV